MCASCAQHSWWRAACVWPRARCAVSVVRVCLLRRRNGPHCARRAGRISSHAGWAPAGARASVTRPQAGSGGTAACVWPRARCGAQASVCSELVRRLQAHAPALQRAAAAAAELDCLASFAAVSAQLQYTRCAAPPSPPPPPSRVRRRRRGGSQVTPASPAPARLRRRALVGSSADQRDVPAG